MRDVSAVVLTLGEVCTDRALASVRHQVAETVVVEGISPFHRALNAGAGGVRTEFFVQVDADMVLDETCVATLRATVTEGVGVVVGFLLDPLLGRIEAVKLFRTACFHRVQFRDSISPDTDFLEEIWARGWMTVYALKYGGARVDRWHIFGAHDREYDPDYTFAKFTIEGARRRYRRSWGALSGLLRRLQHSSHATAQLATIACAHGFFGQTNGGDPLSRFGRTADGEFLQRFLSGVVADDHSVAVPECLVQSDLGAGFRYAYALGSRLRQDRAAGAFVRCLEALRQQPAGDAPQVALLGLCHGLFAAEYDEAAADEAFTMVAEFVPTAPVAGVGASSRGKAGCDAAL